MSEIAYIICTGTNGRCVIFGYSDTEPQPEKPITLRRARMIMAWAATEGGLFGLAHAGPASSETRLTAAVKETTMIVRQAITLTPEAAAAFDAHPTAEFV